MLAPRRPRGDWCELRQGPRLRRGLVKTLALPWPEIFVPADDRTRDLLAEGTGIAGLPRLFLIDRDGILRWDGTSTMGLDDRIAALLDQATPPK